MPWSRRRRRVQKIGGGGAARPAQASSSRSLGVKYEQCLRLSKNVLFCWKRYNWIFDDFVLGSVDSRTVIFRNFCMRLLGYFQLNDAFSLLELLMLREGYICHLVILCQKMILIWWFHMFLFKLNLFRNYLEQYIWLWVALLHDIVFYRITKRSIA